MFGDTDSVAFKIKGLMSTPIIRLKETIIPDMFKFINDHVSKRFAE